MTCFFVLQTTGPQDQNAVDEYIKLFATKEQRAELLESLPRLGRGEAWIYGPGEDPPLYHRVQIRKRRTFNSSATPERGEQPAAPKRLADVDIDALRERLAATIEKAKAEDPGELRKQLAAARADLDAGTAKARAEGYEEGLAAGRQEAEPELQVFSPFSDDAFDQAIGNAEAAAALAGEATTHAKEALDAAALAGSNVDQVLAVLRDYSASLEKTGDVKAIDDLIKIGAGNLVIPGRPPGEPTPSLPTPRPPAGPPADGTASVSKLGRQIIEALGGFPDGLTIQQLAALVGKKATGGYVRNTISALRTGDLVVGGNDRLQATQAGLDAIGGTAPALTRSQILERWYASPKMTGKAKEILQVLLDHHPQLLEPESVASLVGTEPTGGYFRNSVSFLASNGLAERVGRNLKASDTLFTVPA